MIPSLSTIAKASSIGTRGINMPDRWIDTIRDALAAHIESEGRGAMTELARELEIPRASLHDFWSGKSGLLIGPFERLSKKLGYRLTPRKPSKSRRS